jgi:hypothetical protein
LLVPKINTVVRNRERFDGMNKPAIALQEFYKKGELSLIRKVVALVSTRIKLRGIGPIDLVRSVVPFLMWLW